MKLGVYNAILHDRPLPEALKVIAGLGLTGIEITPAACTRRTWSSTQRTSGS